MTTQTITASYDTFARQDTSETNYGDLTYFVVRGSGTSVQRFAYLFFPVSLPSDATIVSATLTLTLKSAWTGGGDTLTASRVTQTWKEGQLTWTNRPSVSSTHAATAAPNAAADATLSITITDIVQDWVDGSSKYGLRLDSSLDSTKSFYSSEAAPAKRPVLTINYALPGEVPTDLRPDGAAAVSEEEPLFTWTGSTPYEVRLQIDSADTFDSAPGGLGPDEWDTEWVQWTQTSYDSFNDDSPPLLVSGNTYYWRVRTRDENGATTDWSAASEFTYYSHGTLSITTPAADNDNVESTTPSIVHSFSDRTQATVQYILYEDDVVIYTGDPTASTATTFELPETHPTTGAQLIKNTTSDYRIVVRVWDTITRSAVGALPYVEEDRVFQYAFSATPDPVTSLAGSSSEGHVALTWSRASQPDYFAIEVDGDIVLDRLDASDLFTGGTAYAYDFYRGVPRTSQTYKVHAVVLASGVAQMPDDSPSVAVTFTPNFVYLIDETDNTEVGILGRSVEAELGEEGTTFFPLSQQAPVRVVDVVRGFEGTVSGTLAATKNQTIANAKANFLEMKEHPDHDFRLIYGYKNFPVTIGDTVFQLIPAGEQAYSISFDFWQVGEFEVVQ